MHKITVTNDDGSMQDFFRSHTPTPRLLPSPRPTTVAPEVNEVDLILTDGSTKKFRAAA